MCITEQCSCRFPPTTNFKQFAPSVRSHSTVLYSPVHCYIGSLLYLLRHLTTSHWYFFLAELTTPSQCTHTHLPTRVRIPDDLAYPWIKERMKERNATHDYLRRNRPQGQFDHNWSTPSFGCKPITLSRHALASKRTNSSRSGASSTSQCCSLISLLSSNLYLFLFIELGYTLLVPPSLPRWFDVSFRNVVVKKLYDSMKCG